MLKITIAKVPAQTFTVVLNDQSCDISLYSRGYHLYLDLMVDGEAVCAGSICQNGPSILQYPNPKFSGTLHFWDTQGSSAPRWEELGERYLLIYCEPGEAIPEAFV